MRKEAYRHDEKKLAEVKASSPIRTSLYEREGSMWGVEAAFTEALREIRSEASRDTF
jgi:hypothetical protein